VEKKFKLDFADKKATIYSSDDFAKLLVATCIHLRIDFSLYLGAHAGYWISPIKSNLATIKFICIEANPLVYNRYKDRLSCLDGIEYQNLAVSLYGGNVELKIPMRLHIPQTLFRRLDHFIFRAFHKSFQREREGWETEATIVESSTNNQFFTISIPSLTLADLLKKVPIKSKKLLLTDLEGFDFELMRFNKEILHNFDLICFEYHFDNSSSKMRVLTVVRETLKDCGFELISIGADCDDPSLVNLLFYKLSVMYTDTFDITRFCSTEITVNHWKYQPSLASRLDNIPGKSLILRFLALIGLDVFKSR